MHFLASLFHHTQAEYITFAFKVALIVGITSAIAFIIQYTRYAPWWKDSIGKRIVYETIAIAILYSLTALSLFFHLNRLTSNIVAWVDVGLLSVVAGIVIWGMVVWKREKDHISSQIEQDEDDNDYTGEQSDSI